MSWQAPVNCEDQQLQLNSPCRCTIHPWMPKRIQQIDDGTWSVPRMTSSWTHWRRLTLRPWGSTLDHMKHRRSSARLRPSTANLPRRPCATRRCLASALGGPNRTRPPPPAAFSAMTAAEYLTVAFLGVRFGASGAARARAMREENRFSIWGFLKWLSSTRGVPRPSAQTPPTCLAAHAP